MPSASVATTPTAGSDVPVKEGDILVKQFRLSKCLGAGRRGWVFLAKDLLFEEEVALKIILLGSEQAVRQSFENLLGEIGREWKTLATSHVITAYPPRLIEHKGQPLVLFPMEYADRGSLRSWLRENPNVEKRIPQALAYFRQACLGVRALHALEIQHHAIKPENILLVGNLAKVSGFASGRLIEFQHRLPEEARRLEMESLAYSSPEQLDPARKEAIGAASDVYSLGIVLYEILTGQVPFSGEPDEAATQHLQADVPPIRGPGTEWAHIVRKCLRKDPAERYGDVESLVADLDQVSKDLDLSRDVSCPQCGYINADATKFDCENCGGSIKSLFHLCPQCYDPVRLDLAVCPICEADVRAYYVLQARWKRIQAVRNTDPAEAIRLLEQVLHGECDEKEREAKVLRADLQGAQEQLAPLISAAEQAFAEGELEQAELFWEQVLSVWPDHRLARENCENVQRLRLDYPARRAAAREKADRGQFDKALRLLEGFPNDVPDFEATARQLNEIRTRGQKYATSLRKAQAAWEEKALKFARAHVKAATSVAPKSPEALALQDQIAQALAEAGVLSEKARGHLGRAEFQRADEYLTQLEAIQSDDPGVARIRDTLKRVRGPYELHWERAKRLLETKTLLKALVEVQAAAQAMKTPETLDYEKEVTHTLKLVVSLLEETKTAIEAGEFEKAEQALARSSSLQSDHPELPQIRDALTQTRDRLTEALARTEQAFAGKDLSAAAEAVQTALDVCPGSARADELARSISANQEAAQTHLALAQAALNEADFAKAKLELRQCESLWLTLESAFKLSSRLSLIEPAYALAISSARQAMDQGNCLVAKTYCREALSLCPKAPGPAALAKEIDELEKATAPARSQLERNLGRESFADWLNRLELSKVILVLVLTLIGVVVLQRAFVPLLTWYGRFGPSLFSGPWAAVVGTACLLGGAALLYSQQERGEADRRPFLTVVGVLSLLVGIIALLFSLLLLIGF